ncbi:hypothetical protein D3C80_1384100 [compost metagenome]
MVLRGDRAGFDPRQTPARRGEGFAPAIGVQHQVAGPEVGMGRGDDLAHRPAVQRLAQFERRHIVGPVIQAVQHIGIDRHPEVPNLNLALGRCGGDCLDDLQVRCGQIAVRAGFQLDVAGGQGGHGETPKMMELS